MDKELLQELKTKLFDLKHEIIDHLAQENEDFRGMVEDMDPKDLVDIASEDIDRKTLEALGAQEFRRLNLIESALARIENDRYGICMRCGSKIPKERLEAIPYALLCVACQTKEERRNR